MDIWTCISVAGVAFFVGIVVGGVLVSFSNRIEAEIDYLRNKEEELKELEARITKKQGENPPAPFDDEPSEPEDAFSEELAVILMKEQRLAYEAEEERLKKKADERAKGE